MGMRKSRPEGGKINALEIGEQIRKKFQKTEVQARIQRETKRNGFD